MGKGKKKKQVSHARHLASGEPRAGKCTRIAVTMVDAVGVSPVEVLKELGDFASSFNAKRRGQRLFVRSTSRNCLARNCA